MSEFYVALIQPDGTRDYTHHEFAGWLARDMVAWMNRHRPDAGEHLAIPVEDAEAWKAGTWTP